MKGFVLLCLFGAALPSFLDETKRFSASYLAQEKRRGSIFANTLLELEERGLNLSIAISYEAGHEQASNVSKGCVRHYRGYKKVFQYEGPAGAKFREHNSLPIPGFNDSLMARLTGKATPMVLGGRKAPIFTEADSLFRPRMRLGMNRFVFRNFAGYPPERLPSIAVLRDVLEIHNYILDCREKRIVTPGSCADGFADLTRFSRLRHVHSHTGVAYLVSNSYAYNYAHFTMEQLPRLVMALDFLKKHTDVRVVTFKVSFVISFFEFFGLDPQRILPVKQSVSIIRSFSVLYYPQPMPCMTINSIPLMQLRQYVFDRLGLSGYIPPSPTTAQRPLRVVFALRNDKRDEFPNFMALMRALSEVEGTEVVLKYLSKSNVTTQIREYNLADIVIGAHGAQFANVMWMRSGTDLIEINSVFYAVECYYHLASKVGVNFHWVLTPQKLQGVNGHTSKQMMTPNVTEIIATVKTIVVRRAQGRFL